MAVQKGEPRPATQRHGRALPGPGPQRWPLLCGSGRCPRPRTAHRVQGPFPQAEPTAHCVPGKRPPLRVLQWGVARPHPSLLDPEQRAWRARTWRSRAWTVASPAALAFRNWALAPAGASQERVLRSVLSYSRLPQYTVNRGVQRGSNEGEGDLRALYSHREVSAADDWLVTPRHQNCDSKSSWLLFQDSLSP